MKNRKPTMKDVSREAGVALGTVSRVFNGQPVGEEYRIKVEEAAQKLGYQVNPCARGLKTNKTNRGIQHANTDCRCKLLHTISDQKRS